jgi:hypothetical protein
MTTGFRKFIESQDVTAAYVRKPNDGFFDQRNRSFEEVVEPLVKGFVQQIMSHIMGRNNLQLSETQVKYISESVKRELEKLQYNPQNDIGQAVNTLWKQGNRRMPQQPVQSTPHNGQADTPLASVISQLWQK